MKTIIKSFAKAQFSKKITAIVVGMWILAIISRLFTDKIVDIMDYVQNAFYFATGGYLLKTIPENVMKISKNAKIVELASKVGIDITGNGSEGNNGES